MIVYDDELKIYHSDKVNDENYFAGFGTKQLGDGRNLENIIDFLEENDLSSGKLIVPEQIHSSNVELYAGQNPSRLKKIEDSDGIITLQEDTTLTVISADCVPIVFADKNNGVIGISHQGWRGTLKKLSVKMIKKLVEAGAEKEQIVAAIGPGIGACCYDIDEDRYLDFFEEFEEYSSRIFTIRQGRKYLNLNLLNYLLLTDKAGIKKENVDFFPFCTSCNEKKFFSARRMKRPNFQRQFSFIIKLK